MYNTRVFRFVLIFQLASIGLALHASGQPLLSTFNGREYRNQDNKWYAFHDGQISDQVLISRLVVRLEGGGLIDDSKMQSWTACDLELEPGRIGDGFYVILVSPDNNAFECARMILQNEEIQSVEFDGIGKLLTPPSDPLYSSQWNLSDKLQIEDAWLITTGDPAIKIGVIDEGVEFTHEDVANNIWQNLGEDADQDGKTLEYNSGWILDPGDLNGVDDDGNGYPDDLIGWDAAICTTGSSSDCAANGDADPSGGPHGINVAGIIGAETGNSIGIAGIAGGFVRYTQYLSTNSLVTDVKGSFAPANFLSFWTLRMYEIAVACLSCDLNSPTTMSANSNRSALSPCLINGRMSSARRSAVMTTPSDLSRASSLLAMSSTRPMLRL